MKITYSDGSFMLSWERVRAWYNADGTLKDCEYKLPSVRAISQKHVHVRAYLARQGKLEVSNPLHARTHET